MPLANTAIEKAKPRAKPYKLYDSEGLYVIITPKGGKWWRFNYRYVGKTKTLSFGVYPDVSLKDARDRRTVARKQVADGIDPSENRKAAKAAQAENLGNTFEVIAREWLAKQKAGWSPRHYAKVDGRLVKDLYPYLGRRPIADIKAQELLKAIQRIEERGANEVARTALEICGQVMRYAIITSRAKYDVSRDLHGALKPMQKGHYAAITNPIQVGGLMRAIRGYSGQPVTRCALQLAPLVFTRPGELRQAEWSEFNLKKAEWIIPAKRMKIKDIGDHLVPLSTQALVILKKLHEETGRGRYVFPSVRTGNRPMSDNAILAALRRMGIEKHEMTGHGFRAMARTILDEVLHVRPDIIEHQLAHVVRDPNGRAYNRTSHLKARRDMMQQWADYLDKLADTLPSDDPG